MTPAISRDVPNSGLDPPRFKLDMAGELRMVKGRDTVHIFKFSSSQRRRVLGKGMSTVPRLFALARKNESVASDNTVVKMYAPIQNPEGSSY